MGNAKSSELTQADAVAAAAIGYKLTTYASILRAGRFLSCVVGEQIWIAKRYLAAGVATYWVGRVDTIAADDDSHEDTAEDAVQRMTEISQEWKW